MSKFSTFFQLFSENEKIILKNQWDDFLKLGEVILEIGLDIFQIGLSGFENGGQSCKLEEASLKTDGMPIESIGDCACH